MPKTEVQETEELLHKRTRQERETKIIRREEGGQPGTQLAKAVSEQNFFFKLLKHQSEA